MAQRNRAFAGLVGAAPTGSRSRAGRSNTDTLLGKDGFVGIKTGSDDAAGGCFMFRSHAGSSGGHRLVIDRGRARASPGTT